MQLAYRNLRADSWAADMQVEGKGTKGDPWLADIHVDDAIPLSIQPSWNGYILITLPHAFRHLYSRLLITLNL